MIAAASNMHEAGIRKAAILLASLDQAAADLLLDQLGPACADRVREAALAIERCDRDEQQRVLDEFRRIGPRVRLPESSCRRETPRHCNGGALRSGEDFSEVTLVPSQCPPGIELDGPMVDLIGKTFLSHAGQTDTPAAADDALPFGFLREAEEDKLSQLLGSERPQTIALVLSHLPPERAGEVLARFTPPLQVEIVRRLADLENTDPETLHDVEQALEARFTKQFAIVCGRATEPDAAARILAACPSSVASSILENLAAYDPALAERFGRRPMEFDDLVKLDDADLLAVFRAAEPQVAQAALLGAPPPLVERILRRMIPDEARILRGKLDRPGPIRLSDVDQSRRQIVALAEQMSRSHTSNSARAA